MTGQINKRGGEKEEMLPPWNANRSSHAAVCTVLTEIHARELLLEQTPAELQEETYFNVF